MVKLKQHLLKVKQLKGTTEEQNPKGTKQNKY